MTLIKQARAFGVGLLLPTQNPVDLDYKALSNAGTWFVGKLQTERDKARLIEGLLGVAAERGTLSDRGYLESVISALGNRVFLMHDVHRGNPILMQSRQALSFLRGPMSREQVAELRAPFKNLPAVGGPQLAEGNPQAMPVATLVPNPDYSQPHHSPRRGPGLRTTTSWRRLNGCANWRLQSSAPWPPRPRLPSPA